MVFLTLFGILMILSGAAAIITQHMTVKDSRIVVYGAEAVKAGWWCVTVGAIASIAAGIYWLLSCG